MRGTSDTSDTGEDVSRNPGRSACINEDRNGQKDHEPGDRREDDRNAVARPVRLREEMRRAEIEEKSGKYSESGSEKRGRETPEKGRGGPEARRGGIREEPGLHPRVARALE